MSETALALPSTANGSDEMGAWSPPADLADLTLDELFEEAHQAIQAISGHVSAAVLRYVRLGETLLTARPRFESYEDFMAWANGIGVEKAQSSQAMRLAFYKDRIPAEALQPFSGADGRVRVGGSVNRALVYLKGLPPVSTGVSHRHPEAVREEAKRLVKTGLSYAAAGEMVGASEYAVMTWCNPRRAQKHRATARKRQRELRAAKKELRNKELARQAGGDLAEAYALCRRLLAMLDRCDGSVGVGEAIRLGHRMEERIVEAMRAERTSS